MTFGNKDLVAASESELLRLGKAACDGLATEARAFVRSAVRNLCPAQASATR